MKKGKKTTDEEFAAFWNAADNRHDVAAHFGISPDLASNRAWRLREKGYSLKRMNKPPILRKKFVDMWNSADSTAEFAEQYGVSPGTARQMAHLYRKDGETLKRMNQKIPQPDFLKAWGTKTSLKDIAEHFGVLQCTIRQRAADFGLDVSGRTENGLRRVEFLAVWNASATARECAKKLGITPAYASQKAYIYRSRGFNAKKMIGVEANNSYDLSQ
jgi:transposase